MATLPSLLSCCAVIVSTLSPASPADAGLAHMQRLALADAGRRSGLPPEAIQLVSAARVTWRDGSLGCPQPGLAYTQALVPGYRVVLLARGLQLDYHAGLRGEPQLCAAGQAQSPLPDDQRI